MATMICLDDCMGLLRGFGFFFWGENGFVFINGHRRSEFVARGEHERVAGHVVLGIGEAELQAAEVEPGSGRDACEVRLAGGFQLVGAAEVVAQREVDLVGGQDVEAHDEVVECLAGETGGLGLSVGQCVVGGFPAVEVDKGEVDACRQVVEPLGQSEVDGEGQMGVHGLVVGLELRAEVLQGEGEAEVGLVVVVVEAEVDGHGYGGVVGQVGEEELEVGSAAPAVGHEVAVAAADGDVLGAEPPDGAARGVGFVHRPVVEVVGVGCHGVAFAQGFDELCAHPGGRAEVGHEVEAEGAVADVGVQCGIVPPGSGIVLDERDVLPSERGNVRGGGQP